MEKDWRILSKKLSPAATSEKSMTASACMGDLEIHPSHSGVHAAGILACNDEVIDFCTVTSEGIAQLDSLIRNI